jgi:hypothetical protein
MELVVLLVRARVLLECFCRDAPSACFLRVMLSGGFVAATATLAAKNDAINATLRDDLAQ